jgi:hypothetical protein
MDGGDKSNMLWLEFIVTYWLEFHVLVLYYVIQIEFENIQTSMHIQSICPNVQYFQQVIKSRFYNFIKSIIMIIR